ncbi:hypothetical protein OJAV_G00177860 [Oryzias javanicus]|uniref:DDE Tnp4 domain-containing protein n=1 Tax=Oryzias javanicus TaxID=123683 RepID=A0A437CCZ3_ORYJA|nr:hypothetical protein OJAV_G00177860 [Oryzias javanicus]
MKTRFRAIFLQALEVHHTFVPHVVTACAVLHNICSCADEEKEEEEEEMEMEMMISGSLWLDQLPAEVSALGEVPPDLYHWLQHPWTASPANSEDGRCSLQSLQIILQDVPITTQKVPAPGLS